MKKQIGSTLQLAFCLWVLAMAWGCKETATIPPQNPKAQAFLELSSSDPTFEVPKFALETRPEVAHSRLVRLNLPYLQTLRNHTKDSSLVLEFMHEITLDLTCDSVVIHSDSLFSWWGRLKGNPISLASIVVSRTSMSMNLQDREMIYEALPLGAGICQLNVVNQLKFGNSDDVASIDFPVSGWEVDPGYTPEGANPEFTVLVLLSKPLHAMCGDVALEQQFENSLNFVIRRFGMTAFKADVIMTCTEIVPVGGNLDTDIMQLKNDPTAKAMRDLAQADVVSMIVPSGTVGGIAHGPSLPITNASAEIERDLNYMNVVVLRNAIADFSFAHEVGHNFGMGHARPSGQLGLPGCNWASLLKIKGPNVDHTARTVMAHASFCPTCPREGVYSNPSTRVQNGVTFGPMGHACSQPAIGDDEPRDNLQILINSFPFVCRYR